MSTTRRLIATRAAPGHTLGTRPRPEDLSGYEPRLYAEVAAGTTLVLTEPSPVVLDLPSLLG